MDSLHAIGFYVSSGVSLAGALGVALLPLRDQRGVALGVAGIGLAGLYLSLSAGFAALVALGFYVCYVIFALFPVAGPRYFFGNATGPIAQVATARFERWLSEGGSAIGTAFPSSHVAAQCALRADSVPRDGRIDRVERLQVLVAESAALAGVPLMFAGAGAAFVGIARFAAAGGSIAFGQEFAVLLAIAAVALVALGLGIAGREGSR